MLTIGEGEASDRSTFIHINAVQFLKGPDLSEAEKAMTGAGD